MIRSIVRSIIISLSFLFCCIPAQQASLHLIDVCIDYSISTKNVTCKGGADGSATVNIISSGGPFSYSWQPATTFTNASSALNLHAGTYSVNITDESTNCSVYEIVQIYEPATAIAIYASVTPISCAGKSDGSITVAAIGGTAPYIFNLTTGQQSPPGNAFTFTHLPYAELSSPVITMYNDAVQSPFADFGWADDRTYTYTNLTHSGDYAISFTPNNFAGVYLHCFDNCIDTTLYSGISFWINGGDGGQTVSMGLNNGSGTAFVNIATKNNPKVQTLPANQWLHIFYNFTDAGFTTPFAEGFQIQDSSGHDGNTLVVIDDIYLIPRVRSNQSITVVDSMGCVAQQVYEIGVAPEITVAINKYTPTCYGEIGTLSASVTNGIPPYTYEWLPSYQTSSSIKTKATVQYDVEYIFSDSISNNFEDHSSPGAESLNSTFFFRGNTSIKYSPEFGQIIWYNPNSITVSDYLGVEFWLYVPWNLSQTVLFSIAMFDAQKTNVTFFVPSSLEDLVGEQVIPANRWLKGFYNFTYWLSYDDDIDFNAIWIRSPHDDVGPMYFDEVRFILASNTDYDVTRVDYYSLIVTDSNQCTVELDSITLNEPGKMSVGVGVNPATCKGTSNGNVTARPKGGTLPYSYIWTVNGQVVSTKPYVNNLGYVNAHVQVTDANDCSVTSDTMWVPQPPAITTVYARKPVSCYGQLDGIITFTVQGGYPPYSLGFSSSSFVQNYVSMMPIYIYSEGLSENFDSTALSLTGNLYDASVPAQSGYYSISFTNSILTFLCTSSSPCITPSQYFSISFWAYIPPQSNSFKFKMTYGIDIGNPNSVQATFNSSGQWFQLEYGLDSSSPAYTYFYITTDIADNPMIPIYIDTVQFIPRWYSTQPQTQGLPAGFQATFVGPAGLRTLDIMDANGCGSTAYILNLEPDVLDIQVVEAVPPSLTSVSNGYITIKATGGTAPYQYMWEQPGGFGTQAMNLGSGVYNVCVVDVNGCKANTSINLVVSVGVIGESISVTAVLYFLVGACALLGVLAYMVLLYKESFYYEKSPLFCKIIHIGILAGYAAAGLYIPTPTDSLCIAFPWLVGLYYTFVYGCLFIKTWRIFWIIRSSKKMQRVNLTNGYICKLLSIYSSVEIIYLVIWTIVDPPKATLSNSIDDDKRIVQCGSKFYGIFFGIFLGYKFLWLAFGAVMAIGSRNMVGKYNESKEMYYVIYNTAIFSIICLPLQGALNNIPYAQVIIVVAYLLIITTFALVALYFNIWMKIFFGDEEFSVNNMRQRGGRPVRDTDRSRSSLPNSNEPIRLSATDDIKPIDIPNRDSPTVIPDSSSTPSPDNSD